MKASPSIYVKFPLRNTHDAFKGYPQKPIFMLIWTTTPWTLPANLAIAVNPDLQGGGLWRELLTGFQEPGWVPECSVNIQKWQGIVT